MGHFGQSSLSCLAGFPYLFGHECLNRRQVAADVIRARNALLVTCHEKENSINTELALRTRADAARNAVIKFCFQVSSRGASV